MFFFLVRFLVCYFPDSTTIPVSTDYFDDTIGVVYTSIVLILSLSVGCVGVASAKKNRGTITSSSSRSTCST